MSHKANCHCTDFVIYMIRIRFDHDYFGRHVQKNKSPSPRTPSKPHNSEVTWVLREERRVGNTGLPHCHQGHGKAFARNHFFCLEQLRPACNLADALSHTSQIEKSKAISGNSQHEESDTILDCQGQACLFPRNCWKSPGSGRSWQFKGFVLVYHTIWKKKKNPKSAPQMLKIATDALPQSQQEIADVWIDHHNDKLQGAVN